MLNSHQKVCRWNQIIQDKACKAEFFNPVMNSGLAILGGFSLDSSDG